MCRVLPLHELQLGRRQHALEIPQLRPAGVHREIRSPEQPLDADSLEARFEHATVDTAPRQVDVHVGHRAQHGERVFPVAAPADVRQNESDLGMSRGQGGELLPIRRFLPRPVASPVLPHVVQHRNPPFPRQLADRVEQGVGRAAAGREFDPDHPGVEAAGDLDARLRRVVGVHGDVAADQVGILPLEREEGGVAVFHVPGRREVDRRRPAPAAEDRGDVDRHSDLAPRREPAGVARAPRGRRGGLARAQRLILHPTQEWAAIAGEFTSAGALYLRYLVPMAAIGPVAATIGGIVFGERGSLLTFGTVPMNAGTAVQAGVLEYVLNLVGAYALAMAIDVIGASVGGQRNPVQALKVAAYGSTPYWLAGAFALFPRIEPLGMLLGVWSVRLFAGGLPAVMKAPRDKSAAYTLLTSIAAALIVLVVTAIITRLVVA